jgi:hypothetical protein
MIYALLVTGEKNRLVNDIKNILPRIEEIFPDLYKKRGQDFRR